VPPSFLHRTKRQPSWVRLKRRITLEAFRDGPRRLLELGFSELT